MDQTGCRLDKPVFILLKDQFTEGYCRHKRMEKWLESNDANDLLSLKESVKKEESAVSVIVLAFNSDPSFLKDTVDSILNNASFMSHIIVVTKCEGDELKEKMEIVNNSGIQWSLDNLKENAPSNLELVNYIFRLVKNNWFYVVEDGDIITGGVADDIYDELCSESNIAAIYREDNDPLKLLINKHAFAQLGGNDKTPWFDKIKTFDNWKEVCRQIS